MLAALNHPNICAIYGFEAADGIRLLVLELVEGDTPSDLCRRLGCGRPRSRPADGRAAGIARQIDALEVAHDKASSTAI
jgi:hypothetical protein